MQQHPICEILRIYARCWLIWCRLKLIDIAWFFILRCSLMLIDTDWCFDSEMWQRMTQVLAYIFSCPRGSMLSIAYPWQTAIHGCGFNATHNCDNPNNLNISIQQKRTEHLTCGAYHLYSLRCCTLCFGHGMLFTTVTEGACRRNYLHRVHLSMLHDIWWLVMMAWIKQDHQRWGYSTVERF